MGVFINGTIKFVTLGAKPCFATKTCLLVISNLPNTSHLLLPYLMLHLFNLTLERSRYLHNVAVSTFCRLVFGCTAIESILHVRLNQKNNFSYTISCKTTKILYETIRQIANFQTVEN